jgi:hypothetical protein
MLELKTKVLKLKFNESECDVKYPTVKQNIEFTKKHKSVENDPAKAVECVLEFLTGLGLSPDIADSLENDHLNAILETIGGVKKK